MKQDVVVELFRGGQWEDHTAEVLASSPITISRGAADEQSQPGPGEATLVFKGWRYNPHNPTSDLFGQIGRNTPLRIRAGGLLRFTGEVSSWAPRQTLGGERQTPHRWVEVTAADMTRRLDQGDQAELDAIRRLLTRTDRPLVAWWPMDDPDGSTSLRPEVGGHHMRLDTNTVEIDDGEFTFAPELGRESLAPWLSGQFGRWTRTRVRVNETTTVVDAPAALGTVDAVGDESPDRWTLDIFVRGVDSGTPPALAGGVPPPSGTVVQVEPSTPGLIHVTIMDASGAVEDLGHWSAPQLWGGQELHHIRLDVSEVSGRARVVVTVDGVVVAAANSASHPLPPLGLVAVAPGAASAGSSNTVGHLAVWAQPGMSSPAPPVAEVVAAMRGHIGEHAARRRLRLCQEDGVPASFVSGDDDSLPMGPQYPGTLMGLLRTCAEVDGGAVLAGRVFAELDYRRGRVRYSRDPTLTLDYAADEVAPPLEPVVDDQAARNDVSVSRRDGATVRRVDQDGPLGVDAAGRTTESVTRDVMSDGHDLESQAGWRLHLGTVAGTRFPAVSVDLDAFPDLAGDVAAVDVGLRIDLVNLPVELSPDTVSLLVLGYTETIGSHRRTLTFHCAPYEPYQIAEVEHPEFGIIGAESSSLFDGITTSQTSVDVDPSDHIPGAVAGTVRAWTYESDFDVLVGGERMTVTAVGSPFFNGSATVQTFTVVRSVNGVVKSHPAGTPVELFHQSYIGL